MTDQLQIQEHYQTMQRDLEQRNEEKKRKFRTMMAEEEEAIEGFEVITEKIRNKQQGKRCRTTRGSKESPIFSLREMREAPKSELELAHEYLGEYKGNPVECFGCMSDIMEYSVYQIQQEIKKLNEIWFSKTSKVNIFFLSKLISDYFANFIMVPHNRALEIMKNNASANSHPEEIEELERRFKTLKPWPPIEVYYHFKFHDNTSLNFSVNSLREIHDINLEIQKQFYEKIPGDGGEMSYRLNLDMVKLFCQLKTLEKTMFVIPKSILSSSPDNIRALGTASNPISVPGPKSYLTMNTQKDQNQNETSLSSSEDDDPNSPSPSPSSTSGLFDFYQDE